MKKIAFISLILLAVALLSPIILREVVFRMPAYSANFDCDDGALYMLERLEDAGIDADPILGNLKLTGEQYSESNHVWVLARIAGREIALDRGVYYIDGQHYEGFKLSRKELIEFVWQDLNAMGHTPASPAGP